MVRRFAILVALAALLVPEHGPRIVGEGFDEPSTLTRVVVSLFKPPNEFTARDKENLSACVFIWASYFLVILSRIRHSFYLVMAGKWGQTLPRTRTTKPFEFGVFGLIILIGVFWCQISVEIRSRFYLCGLAVAS